MFKLGTIVAAAMLSMAILVSPALAFHGGGFRGSFFNHHIFFGRGFLGHHHSLRFFQSRERDHRRGDGFFPWWSDFGTTSVESDPVNTAPFAPPTPPTADDRPPTPPYKPPSVEIAPGGIEIVRGPG